MKSAVTVIIVLMILGIVIFLLRQYSPSASNIISTSPSPAPNDQPDNVEAVKILATGLEVPWALAFLPNNDLLITERRGTVKLLNADGKVIEVGKINGVKQITESGLHGVAVDPGFSTNQYVYFYYTYGEVGGNTANRVARLQFDGQKLTNETTIVDNIPGAQIHDGGRLKFGPDGHLYITTGDAANPSLSQDKNSLAGKILKVSDEGNVKMYSYGHRNPQGIAWDRQGRLWETEHGQSATDEVNLIEEGKNYGWPTTRGEQKQQGMQEPVLQSGSDTWAPAGATFYKGSVYFGGLKGQALYQFNIDTLELKEHFKRQFGRIRDVVLGPDNMLYITTSNRDGRGNPAPDDDKIIRINPRTMKLLVSPTFFLTYL
ncbi:MAG: hypothetical protein G01um10147_1005 [Microgenomates group bacterium Gr01-1014_7]|nr:MAG: hypothetical protein G01um10147_1005 [Microgenomates group bacterium Gr01-1014_7]